MSHPFTLTYVSCFINIHCKEPHKTHHWRFDNFIHIAKQDVPIILYISEDIHQEFQTQFAGYPNVLLRVVNYEDTWMYKACFPWRNELPSDRNVVKDTHLFLTLMNMKVEFMAMAIDENPFATDYFSWIDFNLCHIFKKKSHSSAYMRSIAQMPWNTNFLANPGCWDKDQGQDRIANHINWRFCGGFLLGHQARFQELFSHYKSHFIPFMQVYNVLPWEVNFWAWLETHALWKITWYHADHDDSILYIPSHLYSVKLMDTPNAKLFEYSLPTIDGFSPSSSSFCVQSYGKGNPILNTRYINYKLDEYGRYIIHHPQGHLITKNVVSVLSSDFSKIETSDEVWDGLLIHDLPLYDRSIDGYEDVRIFNDIQGNMKYVCTNKSHSSTGKLRIMVGDYNADMKMFESGIILNPPQDTACEKNWIPIESPWEYPRFIYQWNPYQIGCVNWKTQQLEIQESIDLGNSFFRKIRGSSIPVYDPFQNAFIAVVHYCEHPTVAKTLEYYHLLVMFDSNMKPIQHSEVFHFCNIGIQYCIGFDAEQIDTAYTFWISRHDSNPACIQINKDEFIFRPL